MTVRSVSVRCRNCFFDSEQVIDIAEFGRGLRPGRNGVGIAVMVVRRNDILETLPGKVIILSMVKILDSRIAVLPFTHDFSINV